MKHRSCFAEMHNFHIREIMAKELARGAYATPSLFFNTLFFFLTRSTFELINPRSY